MKKMIPLRMGGLILISWLLLFILCVFTDGNSINWLVDIWMMLFGIGLSLYPTFSLELMRELNKINKNAEPYESLFSEKIHFYASRYGGIAFALMALSDIIFKW